MKKIMFNDKYGLTKAVLEGRKTQTRRIVHIDPAIRIDGCKTMPDGSVACAHLFENMWMIDVNYKASYKVGEEVAIAQSYKDAKYDPFFLISPIGDGKNIMDECGWENKMFVKADLMPHRIKITNIRIERLQDISDEDCLKEGVEYSHKGGYYVGYDYKTGSRTCLGITPKGAFASLIDKVSGKGTWDSNPYVFAYYFELVK